MLNNKEINLQIQEIIKICLNLTLLKRIIKSNISQPNTILSLIQENKMPYI